MKTCFSLISTTLKLLFLEFFFKRIHRVVDILSFFFVECHHHHHYYYYIIILLLFDSHFMTSSINKEPKTKHNYTLEIKSDTNALTLFASSEPHMWTRFQTACTISWSARQHVSPITSFTYFSPRQISPTSNFL